MGNIEEQYDKNRPMYSDDRYSAFIQREHNKPFTMSTRDADLLLAIKRVI